MKSKVMIIGPRYAFGEEHNASVDIVIDGHAMNAVSYSHLTLTTKRTV